MSHRLFLALLLVPLACTDRPIDSETSASDTDAASTGGLAPSTTAPATTTAPTTTAPSSTTSTTASPDPTATTIDPETSGGSTSAAPGDTGTTGCDIWAENCPEGQKCVPWDSDGDEQWDSFECVPIAPDPAGLFEPCTAKDSPVSSEDTCDEHMICWDVDPDTLTGHCIGMCTGTPDDPGCADPGSICHIPADSPLYLCIPACNPLLQDCMAGELCMPHGQSDSFVCAPVAEGFEGEVFGPCEFDNACVAGLVCLPSELAAECDPMTFGCCLPYCDISQPNDCPGAGQQCLPWYEQGQAPDGLENVGICGTMKP